MLTKDIGLAELSRRSELSITHLSKIRCGEILQPDIKTVQKIAAALGVNYLRLMPDD